MMNCSRLNHRNTENTEFAECFGIFSAPTARPQLCRGCLGALLTVMACLPGPIVIAEEPAPPPPKVDVQVYYSKGDPKWAEAENAIDAVAKTHAILNIQKICIDNAEGYRKLVEAEKTLKIQPTG